jgi:hypothetical protein
LIGGFPDSHQLGRVRRTLRVELDQDAFPRLRLVADLDAEQRVELAQAPLDREAHERLEVADHEMPHRDMASGRQGIEQRMRIGPGDRLDRAVAKLWVDVALEGPPYLVGRSLPGETHLVDPPLAD